MPDRELGCNSTLSLTSALDRAPAAWPRRRRPGTRRTGGWVSLGSVWRGVENLATTGIRSPDRPAFSESVYRLRYSGPQIIIIIIIIIIIMEKSKDTKIERMEERKFRTGFLSYKGPEICRDTKLLRICSSMVLQWTNITACSHFLFLLSA